MFVMSLNQNSSPESNVKMLNKLVEETLSSLSEIVREYHLDNDGELLQGISATKKRALSNEIVLTVLGEFSSGKSTFLNKLLGSDILATGIIPTTAVSTRISYSTDFENEAVLLSGERIKLTKETVGNYAAEGKKSDDVEEVIVRAPIPLLSLGLTIIDTPGVNVNIKVHEATTAKAIQESNACVFLMDARQPGKRTTIDFLNLVHERVDKFFFVLNKADILDEDERVEAEQYLIDVLSKQCSIKQPKIWLISSAFDDNSQWAEKFKAFEIEIQRFMEKQRQLVISNEVAKLLMQTIERAESILIERWRLIEIDLEERYKTRMPDSSQIVNLLKETIAKSTEESYTTIFREYNQLLESNLKNVLEKSNEIIKNAQNKKQLKKEIPQRIDGLFIISVNEIDSFLTVQIEKTFSEGQDLIKQSISELFKGIKIIDFKLLLNNLYLWILVILGAFAGAIIGKFLIGFTKSWVFTLGSVGAIVGALLYFVVQLIKRSKRFRLPKTLTFRQAIQINNIGQSQLLAQGAKDKKAFDRNVWMTAKIANSLLQATGLTSGLILGGAMLVSSLFDKVFGPSMDEVKSEMLGNIKKRSSEIFNSLTVEGEKQLEERFSLLNKILNLKISESVSNYEKILNQILKKQHKQIIQLEERRTKLTSRANELRNRRLSLNIAINKLKQEIE